MAHVAIFPDTSGKASAVYLLEEQGFNTRVYISARCIADKVPMDDAVLIAAAIRDAFEQKERTAQSKEGTKP